MRSATSFFDFTIFSKSIKRFWPLWGSYLFLWLLLIPFHMVSLRNRTWDPGAMAEFAGEIHGTLLMGLYMAFVFSLAAAMAVFGYLYNSRAACMTHALPLRRESLFWSNYLAGLLFLIGPNLLVALVTLGIESLRNIVDFQSLGCWLLLQCGACLFFYSFAVFCGMFTGNTLALPIFYGILNFLVWYLEQTVMAYMAQFLYGMDLAFTDSGLVQWCTPLLNFHGALRPNDAGYPGHPDIVAVYAVAGVVLTALALMVYKRRHIETAGDVVAVRVVRPVFQYGVAISSGLLGTILLYVFWGVSNPGKLYLAVSVIIWSVVGYFVATMLLDKTFKVFHRWKGAAGLAAVLLLFTLVLQFDLLGFERRVPKAEDVSDIPYFTVHGFGYYDGTGSNRVYIDEASGLGTDPERQAKVIALQQAIVSQSDSQREQDGDNTAQISFGYQLANGSSLDRRYDSVPVWKADRDKPGTVTYCLEQLLQDRQIARYSYNMAGNPPMNRLQVELQDVIEEKSGYRTGIYELDNQTAVRLWEAVQQDFDEGTIGVRYLFMDEAWDNIYTTQIRFYWPQADEDISEGDYRYSYSQQTGLALTPHARHTLAVLEESGVMEGYRFSE